MTTTTQPQATTLAQARNATQNQVPVVAGFFDLQGFELMQRTAKAFASSSLVPQAYQNNLPNCMIAMDMAQRIGANPLMVMQNLYIVHGTPGWSSKFLIATINVCGRYSSLRYEWKGEAGTDDYGCRAWAIEKATGERLDGIWVTWAMVKAEGWASKNGSKWKTMADQMFVYRAAAFWQRAYAPELGMGLSTAEELSDTIDAFTAPDGTIQVDVDGLRAKAAAEQPAAPDAAEKDPAGDVTDVSMNAPSSAAQAETTNPASAAGAAPEYLDADKVLASIKAAQDHDVLAVAADSIQDCDPARAAELKAAYQRRLDELDGVVSNDGGLPFPPEDPAPQRQPARQARSRRADAADME